MYTRLENRREKQLTSQKQKANKQESVPQPLKERKVWVETTSVVRPTRNKNNQRRLDKVNLSLKEDSQVDYTKVTCILLGLN